MTKQDIENQLSENQKSQLNKNHLAGFQFLKNAGAVISHPTDDKFSKVEKLGIAISHLEGLRLKAKANGIPTSFVFKNSNNPKESWSESEKLGLSVLLPSKMTTDANSAAADSNLIFLSKESESPKELEIYSKVGFVLKESQLIESLLKSKPVTQAAPVIPPIQTPKEVHKVRSWEKDLLPESKKRSW